MDDVNRLKRSRQTFDQIAAIPPEKRTKAQAAMLRVRGTGGHATKANSEPKPMTKEEELHANCN